MQSRHITLIRLALVLWTAAIGLGQIPYNPEAWKRSRPTYQGDIAQRLAASDLIVIGTVQSRPVYPRRSQPVTADPITNDGVLPILRVDGRFARFAVETTITGETSLCGSADFAGQKNSNLPNEAPNEVFLLGPLPFLRTDDPDPEAFLLPGGRYLLFLRRDPDAAAKVEEYDVNREGAYYTVVAKARGAIQLEAGKYVFPDPRSVPASSTEEKARTAKLDADANSFLAMTTELCNAVRPEKTNDKLKKLKSLGGAKDKALQQNTDYLIQLLNPQTR